MERLQKNKAVAGFKDWHKVVFDFKHGFFAYALAILLPILHLILTCIIGGYEKGSPIYAHPPDSCHETQLHFHPNL